MSESHSDEPRKDKPVLESGGSKETFEDPRFRDDQLLRLHSQLLREKGEPTDNYPPLPLYMVFIFMILAFWAGIYTIKYSGGFNKFHYNEQRAFGVSEGGPAKQRSLSDIGKRVYSQNCVACHMSSGMGQPGVYPPLVNSDWVQDNPRRLVKIILAGLQGEVQVNGVTYNNAMTAFGNLSDREIAGVLSYIRTDPVFENSSYEVSEDLVAEVRGDFGTRAEPWTQDELEEIHGPVTGDWEPEPQAMPASAPGDSGEGGSAGEGEGDPSGGAQQGA